MAPASFYSPETDARSSRTHVLIIAFLVAAVAAGLWYYFASEVAERITPPRVTARQWPKTIPSSPRSTAPTAVSEQATNIGSTAPVTVYSPPVIVEDIHETNYVPPRTADLQQAQLAEQRRQAEQWQQEQTQRHQLAAERARQDEKARGQDVIIPLDQDCVVNVGGSGVRVKIHDNDVTSFDVWINGAWHREVPKQKGITQSRTDETFVYDAGRARLYYVWEQSGKLNHCLLRIRED